MNEYEPNPMLQNIVKKPKKVNKLPIILGAIIVILLIIIVILLSRSPSVITNEVEREQSLDEVALEIEYFISENKLDALDVYGYDDLLKIAIDKICDGVLSCTQVSGEAMEEYISNVFDKEAFFADIACELNDGNLYTYDSEKNIFVYDNNHLGHGSFSRKPIYTKVNSINRDGDNIYIVLNKLYYSPDVSEYITSDPLGIYRIYKAKDYLHTTDDGEDIDYNKLKANYENNFDNLKNIGTSYSYVFSKKDGHYVLSDYEVIES